MPKPPGNAGLPIIGDKSLEFYKDAISFVEKRIAHYDSRIFQARFLNQATVFIASNAGAKELVDDVESKFEMGYKQFMSGIYGDNVVFEDGEEAQYTRTVLQKLLLCNDTIEEFQQTCNRLTTTAVKALQLSPSTIVYPILKKLSAEICLSVFLNVDFENSRELAENIVSLTTTHWHGIISVPLNIKLPGVSQKSTYGKALEAKEKLLDIIRCQLDEKSESNRFTSRMRETGFRHAQQAYDHVLLFTSALVPKAMASILTSFIIVLANQRSLRSACREDESLLARVLLETQRLWPPFVGGRRIAKQACTLQGLDIPQDSALVFMTYHAQRDPAVFRDPHDFLPARWQHQNKGDEDKLLLFGGGSRCCLGQHLVTHLIQGVAKDLLERYDWSLREGQDLTYKWLPVARPRDDLLSVTFTPRHSEF